VFLSPREAQLLELAAHGLVDKEIAARLQVSVATVRTYWERIRKKLGASNRAEAVALAHPRIAAVASPSLDTTDRSARIGVVGIRLDRTICFATPAAEEMFGVGRGQLDGRTISSLISERFQAFHEHLRTLSANERAESSSSLTFSVFGKRLSGALVPLASCLHRVQADGMPLIVCLLKDHADDAVAPPPALIVDRAVVEIVV
jgi:DNA-binding CsgD family transcriptional regulator